MGRYENALKYVQLRSMIEEKNYEEALKIAEQLEMGKIKDVSELKLIADVYRKCGDYGRAKELYYIIYKEHRIRKNLYTLIMICLREKNFEEAESLFKEYITIDKGSIFRYILRYRIDKSKGSDISVIIKDLEIIKREFYMEDWGYELARMYHKAGRIEECLAECDDIILWFGEGEVVEKAKLLKMHYDENVDGEILHSLQESIGNDISRYMDDTAAKSESEQLLQSETVEDESAAMEMTQEPENEPEDIREAEQPEQPAAEETVCTEEQKMSTEYGNMFEADSNDKLMHNALTEAAGFKNALFEAAKNNEEVEEISIEEKVTEVSEDVISVEVNEENEDVKPDDADIVTEADAAAEADKTNNETYALSKYGSRFNYIDADELYDRMNVGVHAPANYAIALGNNDNASGIVREIAKIIKAQGYLKNPRIARISAKKLNSIRLYDQINELLGTCMLIEDASEMSSKTINVIIKIMDAHASEIVMIFVDKEEKLSKFLLKESILCNQIDNFVLN